MKSASRKESMVPTKNLKHKRLFCTLITPFYNLDHLVLLLLLLILFQYYYYYYTYFQWIKKTVLNTFGSRSISFRVVVIERLL